MAPSGNVSTAKHSLGDGLASLGPHVEAVQITMLALSVLAIAGRLYGRRAKRSIGADDYCIVLAGLFLAGCSATVLIHVHHYNLGKHIWNIPGGPRPHPSRKQIVTMLLTRIQFALGTALVRISVLLFLCRLNPYARLRMVIWLDIWVNVAHMIFSIFVVFVRCIPVSAVYYPAWQRPKNSRCLPDREIGYFTLAFGVFLNTWTWLLPALIVRKARVSRRKKAGLIAILCLGLVALIAAVFRVPASCKLVFTKDSTWDASLVVVTSAVEFGIGIMAASVPGLKNAIQIFRGRITPQSSARGSGGPSAEPKMNTFIMNRLRGVKTSAPEKTTDSMEGLTTVDTLKSIPHAKLAITASEREMDEFTFPRSP